ncbi:MAG: hypothetical protein EU529_16995 [Promethearchaeota archaeon]|nr:MAG: hypothetical protein EU529_16995 [Candidatus Lokiarchaeota archaeon]
MTKEYSDKTARQVRNKNNKIFAQFQQSPYFSKMFKYCQKEAKYVVEELGEFLYDYELIEPEDWTINQFLGQTYNIQRKCMYSKIFFKALPKVIYHFSLFCEKNNIGSFKKEKIEEFWQDLREGYYEDTFYSSWEEGYQIRQREYKIFFEF